MTDRDSIPPRREKKKPEVTFDLGFGGLFKGLGDFIDLLSETVEASEASESGEAEVKRSGEFRVKGLGDKGRGVYGFSVRTGVGGAPRVERFGNIRASDAGPVVADVREPLVDVFDEGDEIVVAAELPGVADDEIQVQVREDILALETQGERKYAKEILLSAAAEAASLRRSYKNGILEVRLNKKPKAQE